MTRRAVPRPRTARPETAFRTGPFHIAVQSRVGSVREGLALLYAEYPRVEDDAFVDFRVAVRPPSPLRRWLRPNVIFEFDGLVPFYPLTPEQGLPLLEWGLNWTINNFAHEWLVIHAAVVAREDGRAALLPAPPGSGKSTLAAALVHRGWRLLSDELALVSFTDGAIVPLARPVNLKNESIDVIRAFAPEAVLSPEVPNTTKGTVALMKAPGESIRRMDEPAEPAWIVFPRYAPGAEAVLTPAPKGRTFIELGESALTYSLHGAAGFDALAALVDRCACYHFRYGRLDDAIAVFAGLDAPAQALGAVAAL